MIDWIKATKDELSKPQILDLAALLIANYDGRNIGAWSRKARIGNLKNFAEAVNAALKAMSAWKTELEIFHYADLYRENKPIYNEWKGIKWKGRWEKFELEHEGDLRTFHMACRKLDKHLSPAGKSPVQACRQELATLWQKYQTEYKRYKTIQDDL